MVLAEFADCADIEERFLAAQDHAKAALCDSISARAGEQRSQMVG
jgi:hypothetical protein